MIVSLAAAFMIGHPSMRMGFIVFGLPVSVTAWVVAAMIGSILGNRTASLLVPIAVLGVWAFLACLRLDGLDGSFFHKGHVYGFDGSAFVCFGPETGESRVTK